MSSSPSHPTSQEPRRPDAEPANLGRETHSHHAPRGHKPRDHKASDDKPGDHKVSDDKPSGHTQSHHAHTSVENQLEAALMTVTRGLRRGWAESIAHTGLAPHQARALRVIAAEGRLRPSELAEGLRVTPRSVTEVVDALIERGLVNREPDPTDRRAMVLSLTSSGEELAAEIRACRSAHTESVFGTLSTKDRATLLALLDRLGAHLAGT